MTNKVTAVIVVLVVVVVVVGSLFAAGILSLPTSPTKTSTSGSPGAPNVVSSSTVSKAYGGTWQQNSGSSGQISSPQGLQDLMNTSGGGSLSLAPHSGPLQANGLLGELAANGYPSAVATPSTGNVSPLNGLIAFEMGIFAPSGKELAFSSVGFLEYSNASINGGIFNDIYVNVTNVTNSSYTGGYSYMHKGVSSGHEYVFVSAYMPTSTYNGTTGNFTASYKNSFNTSAFIGLDNQFIIFISYVSHQNQTLSVFESLFASEMSVAASVSISQASTFVSSSTLATSLAGSWSQDITAGIAIHNATTLINEWLNASASASSSSIPITATEHATINETIGNITNIGVSLYTSPSSGKITEVGSVGYITFTGNSAANKTFFALQLAISSSPIVGSGFVGGYSYLNVSSQQVNSSGITIHTSVVAVQYKNFIIFEVFSGTSSFTIQELKNVASAEMGVA